MNTGQDRSWQNAERRQSHYLMENKKKPRKNKIYTKLCVALAGYPSLERTSLKIQEPINLHTKQIFPPISRV